MWVEISLHIFQPVTVTHADAPEYLRHRCTQWAGMLREQQCWAADGGFDGRAGQEHALLQAPDAPGKRTCLQLHLCSLGLLAKCG